MSVISEEKLQELIEGVPDIDDPDILSYWVEANDKLVYLEGWSDKCLAGTGFPPMEEGETARKVAYIEDLTPEILGRKGREKGFKLLEGGFKEIPDAENLYGVSYGIYNPFFSSQRRNQGFHMKTDVDTCLKEIADWYIENRREITEPELEAILVKHCEDEAEVQKFIKFLETEPGKLRFRTLLRERKGNSNPDEEKPLEFLNGYAVPLRERAPIEDRTRKLLLAEINSEWTSSRELLKAIEKKRRVYIDMEWALHILLDKLLPEGKVGQATFYSSVASWWNNQPLSCPKCGTWEVNQFFTEGGILIHNHCTKCDHQWGGWEKAEYASQSEERKGKGGSNPTAKYPQIEELGHEIYELVYKHADDGWDFISLSKVTKSQPPYWDEFRDTFIKELAKELKEVPAPNLYGIRAKDKAIGIILEKYRDNFPEAVIRRLKG